MDHHCAAYDDDRLLQLISCGDRKAFTALYRRYWSDLYQSAWKILGDQALSMDVVQDVFVWFWEKRGKWNVRDVESYLHAAVKYKSANAIRSGKLRKAAFDRWEIKMIRSEVSQEEVWEVRELQEVIYDFTGRLPTRCQEVFRLSRFEHLSNKEIASKLNISEKTVENQITIALRRLKRHLGYISLWIFLILFI